MLTAKEANELTKNNLENKNNISDITKIIYAIRKAAAYGKYSVTFNEEFDLELFSIASLNIETLRKAGYTVVYSLGVLGYGTVEIGWGNV